MSTRLNWWWVVATHNRGTVRMEECKKLGMSEFADSHTAATVFTSRKAANEWIRTLKRKNRIPEGIQLRVLSDKAWIFAEAMYFQGKKYCYHYCELFRQQQSPES